jgi:hypothetical protein
VVWNGWKLAGAGAVLVAVLAVAACGGESGSPEVASLGGGSTQDETTTTGASSDDPQEVVLEYTKCMRAEGIDLPDPDFSNGPRSGFRIQLGPGGVDPDDPKFRAARETCEPILATLRQQFDPERQEEFQEAALAFAKCMREHGIDIPDPDFSGGQPGGRGGAVGPFGGAGIDRDDPKFRTAMEACDDVFEDVGGRFFRSGPRSDDQ